MRSSAKRWNTWRTGSGCWPLLLDPANARLLEENKSRPGKPAECIARVTMLFERKGVLGFETGAIRHRAMPRSHDRLTWDWTGPG